MISRIITYLAFIYLFIFSLSCDQRSPVDGDDAGGPNLSANDLMIDNNGTLTIDIVDLNQDESVDFAVIPIDENSGKITGIDISFEILDNSPGFLESSTIIADSSGAQQTFYISPSSNLVDGAFNFNVITNIRTYVTDEPSVNDTISILYEDGNLLTEDEQLDILTAQPDTIALGEESLVTAYLTGTLNGQSGVGIPDQYIHFESLLPEDGPDGSIDFGEMNPEYVKTDSTGMAQSTFTPLSETGFGKLQVTYDDLLSETYIEVLSGEAINVEIEIPTDNNLQVTGGGGIESATITAVVKDGGGNIVNDSYAVIFSVPCPYPIDGTCPIGDGDFSNDIMLDGVPSTGSVPKVVTQTTNGEASVTLNSGNRPGIVTMRVELCEIENVSDDGVCSNVIYEAERIVAAISTGPAAYGQVVAGWAEADSTGGGVFSIPITATFWDEWTNPIADSTSVYWYINPEYIASVDPDSKIGNCGNGEPGQACTNAYYTSGEIFSTGQICAKVSGQVGGDVIACSGGARCEDFSEFDCFSNEDIGCTWNEEFDECYFIASERYCNTLFTQEDCESSDNSAQAPYNCLWDEVAVAAIPEWQASIADGAGCHYAPLVNGLDEQQFSFDADGDGVDDSFTGEWDAAGIIAPDDPFCNIAGLNAIQYQQYGEECASKTVCSWEFVAGGTGSSDGSIGSCLYNGGASGTGYFNPCVDCTIQILPLSPTAIDYCQSDDEPLDILIRGSLTDAYGDPVSLGTLLMAVFDATAFNFISSEDTTIDEDMGYEFDPPIPASATQITDANGEVYWIVQLPNENCQNTNPDDPDVFSCNNVFMRAYLLDPLNGESADLNTILDKNCQP
jgi:hypothetical protein